MKLLLRQSLWVVGGALIATAYLHFRYTAPPPNAEIAGSFDSLCKSSAYQRFYAKPSAPVHSIGKDWYPIANGDNPGIIPLNQHKRHTSSGPIFVYLRFQEERINRGFYQYEPLGNGKGNFIRITPGLMYASKKLTLGSIERVDAMSADLLIKTTSRQLAARTFFGTWFPFNEYTVQVTDQRSMAKLAEMRFYVSSLHKEGMPLVACGAPNLTAISPWDFALKAAGFSHAVTYARDESEIKRPVTEYLQSKSEALELVRKSISSDGSPVLNPRYIGQVSKFDD